MGPLPTPLELRSVFVVSFLSIGALCLAQDLGYELQVKHHIQWMCKAVIVVEIVVTFGDQP